MYDTDFKRILEASQKNTLTLFVGAGVSKLSAAPKWSELIDSICDELGCTKKKVYNSDDYLRIPQMYYYSVGEDDNKYYSFIDKCFDGSHLKPNAIHKMMLDLSPTSFITTNFDDLLEKASVQHCYSYKAIVCDEEVSQINGDKYILKIHGDLKHRNIVLKEEDYLNYSEKFKLIETLLKSIFSTNTVVMIGYGLNDYNIKLILNWAKNLLKDHFNKPVFIYTDDERLSKEELTYHESRGLSVIEYYKCDGFIEKTGAEKYENRYRAVINAINNSAHNSVDGKTKEELFDVLFSQLEPLDAMWTLKPEDIQKRLSSYAIVEQSGGLIAHPVEINIFEYFIELNQMDEAQRGALPEDILEKYKKIISVFSKCGIFRYREGHKGKDTYTRLNGINYNFADDMCLRFDYVGMHQYTKKVYISPYKNYKKAFYLAKLTKYPEAYELFHQVATKAFAEKNYLLYYLAQVNRVKIFEILKNINSWFMCHNYYDLKDVESSALTSEQAEHIFENLPHEVKKTYACFKDLNSVNLLYKNSYESFVDGRKLQSNIDNDTLELGMTSADKVIFRVNNNLHFILGNGLYLDEYSEFKNVTANLMELIVFKYSVQNRIRSHNSAFQGIETQKVAFDYTDFYCFIQYFSSKELGDLFRKYQVKEIEFSDMDVVCNSINNIIDYYDVVLGQSKKHIEKTQYHHKIKSCLIMLRHMTVPQELIDKLCSFIFKYEFNDIYINDKVLFLDYQIARKEMSSLHTSMVIENKLVNYIDAYIDALKHGSSFDVRSTSSGINYIGPNLSQLRFAKRFNQLLEIGLEKVNFQLIDHCTQYLSANMKSKIIRAVKKQLRTEFNFTYFGFLLENDFKIGKELLNALKIHLDNTMKTGGDNPSVMVFPHRDPYDDLINVGYWCLLGAVPADEFGRYVGYNDCFDFYYLYDKFDFDKFNVAWLMNLQTHAIEKISENIEVKKKIRNRQI